MRRLLFVSLVIVSGVLACPASAQQWSGHATLGLSGGHQSNLYLDPVLGTWNPDVSSPFLAVTSQMGLSRNTSRTQTDLMVRAQLHPNRTEIPQFTQSLLRFHYQLHPNWNIGLLGGGTRYRYPAVHETVRTARDSWWALPTLQWTPTSNTMLTLQAGPNQRFEQLPTVTDRQTSGLVSLRATYWLTERVQGAVRLYHSTGRTSTAETTFGGTGSHISATYWPTNSVSVRGNVSVEQLQYETLQPPGTARDRILQTGIEAEWTPRSSLTLFGRARALRATLEENAPETDVHLAAGLRLQVEGVLGGSSPLPQQRRVCTTTDEGVRIRVPYDGTGTVYITGDFNQWARPGIPLRRTDTNTWQTTLALPSGRYAYRLRVKNGPESRWLNLPSYAHTTTDSFGGTNGICTVQ